MAPAELVGIEIGRIAGENIEIETPRGRLDELGDAPRRVGRAPIDHQEGGPATVTQEGA